MHRSVKHPNNQETTSMPNTRNANAQQNVPNQKIATSSKAIRDYRPKHPQATRQRHNTLFPLNNQQTIQQHNEEICPDISLQFLFSVLGDNVNLKLKVKHCKGVAKGS
jgi:hypothetical protein